LSNLANGKTDESHNPEKCGDPDCDICKHDKAFEMPKEIIEAYNKGDLVIFAGAGVSTESRSVFPQTFYELIRGVHNFKSS
jgi:hypothetical protein